jgi:hypothetical protein
MLRITVKVMVFNVTFNNISAIPWRSVLLVDYPEKTSDLPQGIAPNKNPLPVGAHIYSTSNMVPDFILKI